MTGNSTLASRIQAGKFTVTAAITPPATADVSPLKASVEALTGRAHGLLISNNQGVCMSPLAACVHVAAAGMEPVLEMSTRDMNRIALQSSLLGAASLGIRTVLCAAGLHQTLTSSREARGVFDIDPIQLLSIASSLTDGTKMLSGTTTNPFSEPTRLQILGLRKAFAAGAAFVITAPVFDVARFVEWMGEVRQNGLDDRIHIVAGVMPLQSKAEALELRDLFRGIYIPDQVAGKMGIDFAAETAKQLSAMEGVRGIHIHYWADGLAAKVLEAAGIGAEN